MNAPMPRSPLTLVVLTLLNEAPMHPYEMQVKMRERAYGRVVKVKAASVYDTVERLARSGLAEVVETSREGRRPERTVYRLTESGHDELLIWMRDLISTPTADYRSFEAALMLVLALEDKDLVVDLLRRRLATLSGEAAASDAKLAERSGELPRLFFVEEEYAQAQRRSEIAFVRQLVDDLQGGRLEWPHHPSWEERKKL